MARTNRGTVKVYAGTDGIPTVEVGSGLPGPQGEQGLPGASGPGTTVVGNVVTWNSTNGTVLADGGIALSALAPKASPALTGVPTAPTAAAATNTTQIATTAMVQAALAAYIAAQNVLVFKGVIDCSANPNYPAADAGWVYKVSVAGKIGGASGINVEAGDIIICLTDGTASGTQAAVGANWTVIQTNLDGAVIGPASSTDAAVSGFNGTSGKLIKVLTATEIRAAAVLATSDSPQFAGLNIGHATDTTLSRLSAGQVAVEGVQILTSSNAVVVSGKLFEGSTNSFVDVADTTKRVQIAADLVDTNTTRVATMPNKNGVLVLDPTAVTDIFPTFDLRFTHIDGLLFDEYFTRPGVGGYTLNSKGVLVPVVDGPMLAFDVNGRSLGTGFYSAYTNLALWSEDLSNAAYTKSEVTITANAATAPDGTLTMDKIVESTNNATHQVYFSASVTNGLSYTFSFFVAASGRSKLRLDGFDAGVGASNFVDFDLVAETATPSGNCIGVIEKVALGIYRVSATFVAVATASTSFVLALLNASGNAVYTGDGTSGVLAWGAQLAQTSGVVPYVQTTSAAVARALDTISLTGTDFTDNFNPNEGTFYVEAEFPPVTLTIVQFDDGTNNNRHVLFRTSSQISWTTTLAGVTVADLRGSGLVTGQMFRSAYAYINNRFSAAFNGVSPADDVSGALPTTVNRLYISGSANGNIRRIIYWPKALSAVELQRMTA